MYVKCIFVIVHVHCVIFLFSTWHCSLTLSLLLLCDMYVVLHLLQQIKVTCSEIELKDSVKICTELSCHVNSKMPKFSLVIWNKE